MSGSLDLRGQAIEISNLMTQSHREHFGRGAGNESSRPILSAAGLAGLDGVDEADAGAVVIPFDVEVVDEPRDQGQAEPSPTRVERWRLPTAAVWDLDRDPPVATLRPDHDRVQRARMVDRVRDSLMGGQNRLRASRFCNAGPL